MNDFLVTKQDITKSYEALDAVFAIIVFLIGGISLFIMFYLLLISMTQNITEAIWEYGVLRSMGLTLAEGRRVYLYEAYTVVLTASLLGCTIGFSSSILISAQIFTFIELPPIVIFPTWTFLFMLLVSAVTTYFAVYMPMKRVNKRQIA